RAPRFAAEPKELLVFTFEVEGFALGSQSGSDLQIGVAKVGRESDVAYWTHEHVFVPPMLHGAGIMGRFLDALLQFFDGEEKCSRVEVHLVQRGAAEDPAEAQRLLNLYRGRNFRIDGERDDDSTRVTLAFAPTRVTIMRRERPSEESSAEGAAASATANPP